MGIRTSYLVIFSILIFSTTLHAQGTLPFSETGSYGTKFEVNTSGIIFANRYFPANGAIDIFNAQSNGSTRWTLGVYDNLHMTFKVASTERMRLLNTGNLGLGTSNISTNRFVLKQASSNTNYGFKIENAAGDRSAQLWVGTGGVVIDAQQGANLHFRTNNSDRMYIKNSNGYVGIGTANPTSKLHLSGDFRHTGIMVSQGSTYSSTWMQFTQHQYGNSLILGSGGLTAVGSGESGTQVKNNIGASTETLYLSSDNNLKVLTNLQSGWGSRVEALDIANNGNVGIGTSSPGEKLEVNGTVRSKELVIETVGWPDFVFDPGYTLLPLSYVEEYIDENGHLPGVPSQQEVEQNGQVVGETQKILLQKIEELTLYVIELKKENEQVRKELENLKEQIK